MATPFTNAIGSVIVSGTEYSMPAGANYSSGSPQTSAVTLELAIDATGMAAGDQIDIVIYDKVNAGTQLPIYRSTLSGTQAALVLFPPIRVKEGWDATLKLRSGSGSTVKWALRQDVGDRNAASIASAAVQSIWQYAIENAITVEQFFRMGVAVLTGRGIGLEGANPTFRDNADTKDRVKFSYSAGARGIVTRDGT